MENISPQAWKIQIEVNKGREKFNMITPRSYQELQESLRGYQIYSETILEYFNDAGDKATIKSDKDYYNFLSSSNGFFHFLDCKVNQASIDQTKSTTFVPTTNWDCINCFTNNKPSDFKCKLCKYART